MFLYHSFVVGSKHFTKKEKGMNLLITNRNNKSFCCNAAYFSANFDVPVYTGSSTQSATRSSLPMHVQVHLI